MKMLNKKSKERWKDKEFWKNKKKSDNKHLIIGINNKGMGTIEVILIIVVLIGLVVIFRSQVLGFVSTLFEKITSDSTVIMS